MNIAKILTSKKTVFTIEDLELILWAKTQVIRNYLERQKNGWVIKKIYSGIWAISGRDYDIFELGCKFRRKSYVSFESALQRHGIIFQDYSHTITLASDNSTTRSLEGNNYEYRKITDTILLNPLGVEHFGTYALAGKERAICDTIYLKSGFHFDNLSGVDLQKLEEISHLYNKRTVLEIKRLIDYAQTRNT